MSTSARPKVRGACEYCHRRKIRCIISPGDNACQNCAHNGAACLFAPRSKPGRPRRFPSDVGSVSDTSPSWTRNAGTDSISHSPLQSPSIPETDARPDTTLDAPFNIPLPQFDQWLSDDATENVWTPDECMTNTGPEGWALGYFNQLPPAMAMDPAVFLSQRESDRAQGKLPLSPPASTRHTPPSATVPDLTDTVQDGAFTSTLETCRRLDEYCRRVEDPRRQLALSADDDMLAFAGQVCGEAQAKAFEAHSADGALLLAAVLKVLELCGLVFQGFLRGPAPARDDRQLLLLKRLDLLLLQAKIFLTQARQKAGVARAVEIHNSIDATIRNDFPALTWGDAGFAGD